MKLPIYLDHHATTPVDPSVLEAMLPFFCEHFGNAASSDHTFGQTGHAAVESARMKVASLIRARESEIVFTSGATEADNLALFGAMEANQERGNHLITCVTEHKAVLDAALRLEALGKRVTYLPVDQYGRVDPDDVRKAITSETVLISIMAANNEIGTIAPLAEIGSIANDHGILFHTDATQAVGHIPMDVDSMHIDLLSMSAHKFYGPKGIGALFTRRRQRRARLTPIIWGGGHERGLRSGTLNVPAIVGMGEAAVIANGRIASEMSRLSLLSLRFIRELQTAVGGIELNGHPEARLSHNVNLYISNVEAKTLILNLPDLAFSTGAACSTAHVEPSHVIVALQLGAERAHRSIRLGLGRSTGEAETTYAIQRLGQAIRESRAFAAAG